jgi:hypothetical protein
MVNFDLLLNIVECREAMETKNLIISIARLLPSQKHHSFILFMSLSLFLSLKTIC